MPLIGYMAKQPLAEVSLLGHLESQFGQNTARMKHYDIAVFGNSECSFTHIDITFFRPVSNISKIKITTL